MKFIETLKLHSSGNLGEGVAQAQIKDLEARLDIRLPDEFREYLRVLNYAELFNDPIYGINKEQREIDLYTQNKNKDHFNYGFLEIFTNDIDGTIFLRPDTGAVYNAFFTKPIAISFGSFVELILKED